MFYEVNITCHMQRHKHFFVQIECLITFSDGAEQCDNQYYLSSLSVETVEKISTYIHGHWGERKQIVLAS